MKISGFKKVFISLFVLLFLLTIAYIPKINHFGFLQDDWNTVFVIENIGPGSLVSHYSVDRPLHGYFSLLEARLFDVNMTAYQILALSWRYLDALVILLILMLMWPKKWLINLLICSLIIIYPGFHEQPHALDYQTHLFSRLAMVSSLLLCLLPFFIKNKWLKIGSVLISLVLAQICWGLMEYYIGIEVLRAALLWLIFRKNFSTGRFWKFILYWSIYLINAGAFLIWRAFIFQSKRATVDFKTILSGYYHQPGKIFTDLLNLAINAYRLVLSAWVKPFLVFVADMKTNDLMIGIALSLISVLFILIILRRLLAKNPNDELTLERKSSYELILVGLIGAIGALIPIVFGGREISYNLTGDRFSYPGSISACILIIGVLSLIKQRWIKISLFSLLVFSGLLTQYSNNEVFNKTYLQTNQTWWQLSWRAPQIKKDTLLSGLIDYGMQSEDYTIWGPANLIYYPNDRKVSISAEVLNDETKLSLLAQEEKVYAERRTVSFERNFQNSLILTKTLNSCLHVIDGDHPEFSYAEKPIIREVAPISHINRIDVSTAEFQTPRSDLFGPEPEKGWCYFYQKAQLERQIGDWNKVAEYGDSAIRQGEIPGDAIEWLVFLQGFAYTKDPNYQETRKLITSDPYLHGEACRVYKTYSAELEGTAYGALHNQLLSDVCD